VTEPENNSSPPPEPPRRSDYSPWNWLLAVAVIVPLLPFLYNSDKPRLFGFQLFYWLQILFILLGVAATTIVYQVSKRRR
jgi:predicted ferric reductase